MAAVLRFANAMVSIMLHVKHVANDVACKHVLFNSGGWLGDDCSVFAIDSFLFGNCSEAGGTALLTLKLRTLPLDVVMCDLHSANTQEVILQQLAVMPADVGMTTVEITGVSDGVDDGDQRVAVYVTGCNSSDSRFMFQWEWLAGSVFNEDRKFPTLASIMPPNAPFVGGQVTLLGSHFDDKASIVVGDVLVSGPRVLRTLALKPDGTAEEVRCTELACLEWQLAALSAMLDVGDEELAVVQHAKNVSNATNHDERHDADGRAGQLRRRLLSIREQESLQQQQQHSQADPRQVLPNQFWFQYLATHALAYMRANSTGELDMVHNEATSANIGAGNLQHTRDHSALPHRLTHAHKHSCGPACRSRRHRRRVEDQGMGLVSVRPVPYGGMRDLIVLDEKVSHLICYFA